MMSSLSHRACRGQCGSCWAFSTTGSTEGQHALATGDLVSLSEQNLVDCSAAEGNQGCNGGLMSQAFQYIINNKGIDTEASYPYKVGGLSIVNASRLKPFSSQAVDGKCKFNAANVGATISSYVNITSGSETDLQNASATVGAQSITFESFYAHLSSPGPISVAMDAGLSSFQLYKSGVYAPKLCSSTVR